MNNSKNSNSLFLYHYKGCPYCARTQQAIKSLGLGALVQERDVVKTPTYRAELLKNGGKKQVPCLLIVTADKQNKWLYESGDIISYLEKNAKLLKSI